MLRRGFGVRPGQCRAAGARTAGPDRNHRTGGVVPTKPAIGSTSRWPTSVATCRTLRRMLEYKTRWRDGQLYVANRWYPSSKTCSTCGVVKAKLPLRDRVFHCAHCGVVVDRDLNAARN